MKQNETLSLPIDPYLDGIVKDGQNHSTLLIKASPGSGKTTRLPWALARHSGKKVLVLEPRRLAAKLAAMRIADEQYLTLGQEVGYHFRFEKNISPSSRLIFYTEGTFLKTLVSDPELRDVGTVILDEFHERHRETDIALAALRSLQEKRPDLKLVLMSATLDLRIMDYFRDCKVIEIEAPMYPVKIHHLPNVTSVLSQRLEMKIRQALKEMPREGDVLVFVPGMREMLQTQEVLGSEFGEVLLLHADLSREEQEKALHTGKVRRIILATNIAESSVTIPGIKHVIDSGIQREALFSPWSGLKLLTDRPITQSSAIQRAGRAGRTSAGECFRLYAEMDFKEREPFTEPEITKSDLTDTVLLLAELARDVKWLTPPPEERWNKARELCHKLGAISAEGKLTETGKKILSYPLDARLSRALVGGENLNPEDKKKLLRFITSEIEQDRSGMLWNRFQYYLKNAGKDSHWEKALLTGFVDQVARYRQKTHDFIHYSGKTIKAHSSLKELEPGLYLILDVTQKQEAILTVPIDEEWLYDLEPFPFSEEGAVEVKEKISLKTFTKLGSLVMDETSINPTWSTLPSSLREKVINLSETPFRKRLDLWKEQDNWGRYVYWAKLKGEDLSLMMSKLSVENYFSEMDELSFDHLENYLQSRIEENLNLRNLDSELPTKIDLGGRRELKIHYPEGIEPYVEAPIQDFYGQKVTPTILGGKVPLTLKLLGPHKRPIQVTRDLVGFWSRTYPEMKKEYQRDYPRHYWPDQPADAKPFLLKSHVK